MTLQTTFLVDCTSTVPVTPKYFENHDGYIATTELERRMLLVEAKIVWRLFADKGVEAKVHMVEGLAAAEMFGKF